MQHICGHSAVVKHDVIERNVLHGVVCASPAVHEWLVVVQRQTAAKVRKDYEPRRRRVGFWRGERSNREPGDDCATPHAARMRHVRVAKCGRTRSASRTAMGSCAATLFSSTAKRKPARTVAGFSLHFQRTDAANESRIIASIDEITTFSRVSGGMNSCFHQRNPDTVRFAVGGSAHRGRGMPPCLSPEP
eukprot:5774319-Prymnesium_polylepis.1